MLAVKKIKQNAIGSGYRISDNFPGIVLISFPE